MIVLCVRIMYGISVHRNKKSLIKVFNLGFEIFKCPGGQ